MTCEKAKCEFAILKIWKDSEDLLSVLFGKEDGVWVQLRDFAMNRRELAQQTAASEAKEERKRTGSSTSRNWSKSN